MKRIYLDTNFLLIPGSLKVDIFSEIERIMEEPYEICVIDKTLDELKKIIETGKGRDKDAARIGMQLIENKNLKIITKSLYMNINSKDLIVDDILLEIADQNTIIATQDKEFKEKLKKKDIKLIILKKKKYLGLI